MSFTWPRVGSPLVLSISLQRGHLNSHHEKEANLSFFAIQFASDVTPRRAQKSSGPSLAQWRKPNCGVITQTRGANTFPARYENTRSIGGKLGDAAKSWEDTAGGCARLIRKRWLMIEAVAARLLKVDTAQRACHSRRLRRVVRDNT